MKHAATLLLTLLAAPAGAALAQTLTNAGATLSVAPGTVLYVAGGVQNASAGTLTNAGTLQLTGDLANAGALISPGTLLFSGSQDQAFTPGAAVSVGTLAVDKAGPPGANRLFLLQDLTVNSALVLTSGLVRTLGPAPGATLATLSLPDGATVVGEAAGRYVQGRLRVTRTNVGPGSTDFANGLVLNLTGQSLGTVSSTRTAGLAAAGVSYGQNVGGTAQGIDRVWLVAASQPLGPGAPATATLSWVSDDDHGFSPGTPVQLWRADQATGPWVPQGAPGPAAGRTFAAPLTQLGVLTVSNTSQPLPVTLVAFTAEAQGPDALLRWTTASELRNAYFEVESSADGTTFWALGRVAGQGTSSQAHSYQWPDKNLLRYAADPVYYRLRQVDADGTATYSPTRAVRVSRPGEFAAQLYPNPLGGAAVPQLLVQAPQAGPAQWELRDALGRLLARQEALPLPAGASTWALPQLAGLATGVYLLHVRQGIAAQVLKLVRE